MFEIQAQNPSQPPSGNFDLSAWKLQTQDDTYAFTEIPASTLTNKFSSQFFYTQPTDGSMTFMIPSFGETTSGSSYTRTELRQMTNGANWSLTDPTEHYLNAKMIVSVVPSAKPQIVIGQIHGSNTNSELLKLRWTGYLAGKCIVEARYQNNDAVGAEYGVVLASGLSPGDTINYTISMLNGTINCTVNGVSASQTYSPLYYGTSDAYYFKAGNYLNCAVNDVNIIGQTQFYKISLYRDELRTNQTINFQSIPQKKTGMADFSPVANATSGLTVSYHSSNPAVATIVSNKVHIVGAGVTTISAYQSGNSLYNVAPKVSRELQVVLNSTDIDALQTDFSDFSVKQLSSNCIGLKYFMPGTSETSLEIFNISGRKVKTIFQHKIQPAGQQDYSVDVSDLMSGVYFLNLKTEKSAVTKKFMLKSN